MEPLTFLVFTVLFWVPAFVLLLAVFIFYKNKVVRNVLIFSTLSLFFAPIFMIFGTRLVDLHSQNSFIGDYIGQDRFQNTINIEIGDENQFSLMVPSCDNLQIIGTYQYLYEYDAFIFYSNECDVSINENYKGELILSCTLDSECTDLKSIVISKK